MLWARERIGIPTELKTDKKEGMTDKDGNEKIYDAKKKCVVLMH